MIGLLAALVVAHPAGFHERVALSVSRQAVDGLVVLDLDRSETARLIRAGADFDHDGVISAVERGALQKKLVALAVGGLKLGISGFALTVKVADVKMSMRGDDRVTDLGLSVAMMIEAAVSSPIGEGMKLEVEAKSPDESHVVVEVSAVAGRDGGVVAVERRDLAAGEKWSVRLGVLGPR